MIELFNRLKRSISARLLLVFLITSTIMLALLSVIIAHGFATQWRFYARPHLEQYLDFINAEIGNPPSIEKASELADRLSINIYINGPNTSFSTNGETLDVDDETFARPSAREFKRRSFAEANIEFSGDEDRTLLRSIVGDYQVFYELPHRRDARQQSNIVMPVLFSVLFMLSICFLIIRRMLRPVRDIRDGVKRMGEGDLAYRVPIRHNNDLGELADSINHMASDIEQMLDAKRQLLLGASHELRSPLTRAKVATQLLEESKAQQLIEDDLLEMENLIAHILESERMKTGHAALQRQSVDLLNLVHSTVEELLAKNVVVDADQTLPRIHADETRLRILLRNLVGNAITHNDVVPGNNPRSPVKIQLDVDINKVRITVIDTGPGIAPEHIDRVTEPFYRTDASRTRSTGGFGLGLHLAKLIAEAHGGSLQIHSTIASTAKPNEPSGTRVIVELPVTAQ